MTTSRELFLKNYEQILKFQGEGPDGERRLVNLLNYVITNKDQLDVNQAPQGSQPDGVSEADILENIFHKISDVLRNKPLNGRLRDTRHELRKTCLNTLHVFFNQISQFKDKTFASIKLCFEVIKTDSEEIANIAQKFITTFLQVRPDQRRVQLEQLKPAVVAYCEDFLHFLLLIPTLVREMTQEQLEESKNFLPIRLRDQPYPTHEPGEPVFLTYGCHSLKIGGILITYLLRQQWSINPQDGRVIDSVKELLFRVFRTREQANASDQEIKGHDYCLHEDVNNLNYEKHLKATPYFCRALETMCFLFNTVQYLLPVRDETLNINNANFIKHKFGDLVNFFIVLAKSLPGHATDMRHKALFGFYTIYNRVMQLQGTEETRIALSELQITAKNCVISYLEKLLDTSVLLGTGQISHQILHEGANIVYKLFDSLKDKMSEYLIARAMQMLLHCLLNPLTPLILKSTIIFCLFQFNLELKKKDNRNISHQVGGETVSFSKVDLQLEILGQLTTLCKRLNKQTEEGVKYFANPSKKSEDMMEVPPTSEDCFDDIFVLKERELDDACNQSFKISWQHICLSVENQSKPKSHEGYSLQIRKEHYSRTAKNLFLFVENILIFIKDHQADKQTLQLTAMQYFAKFFLNGCHLIQNLSEMLGPNEEKETKMKEVCRSFQILINQLRVSQFKDLLHAVGDDVFGLVIDSKVNSKEGGISNINKNFMQFSTPPNQNQQHWQVIVSQKKQDDFVAVYLDMFFNYIKRKIKMFDPRFEDNPEMHFGLSKMDKRLAKNSFSRVREVMQKKLFDIGDQCLHKAHDIRVKHTFFGVFMYSIQEIRSGHIVHRYFVIIRNLWKEICNLDENSICIKEIMRDFIPMVQGLIETFLQQKDEVSFIKYTKEICCFVPAKLKHLLDYMPGISRPLVENIESSSHDQIESGIHTLQYWLTALATYPELFDPVISHVLPELNACVKSHLNFMPNISMKLMGKLGQKTRQYNKNNEFKPRNYSEDGLKITLKDKHSKEEVICGIDSIIDVLLLKIFAYADHYQAADLSAAVEFVKCAFLTYVDKDFDMDYLIASIIQAKSKDQVLSSLKAPPLYASFDAKKRQDPFPQMTHGTEQHVFEKILRCLIIGCSFLPTHTPELEAVAKKHRDFMKWVTQYFTLIYVCKNKNLTKLTQLDEMNPVIFVDYICEFLYYNIEKGLVTNKKDISSRQYCEGSSFAIKTMIRLLNELYADQPDAFDNLEIVQLLIQQICNRVVDELTRNLAVNIAFQILIDELPQRALKKNCQIILKSLFQILAQSPESVAVSVRQQITPTLDSLFRTIGVYTFKKTNVTTVEDRDIFNHVIDRIMQNVLSPQQMVRACAKEYLLKIAAENDVKVNQLLKSVHRASASAAPQAGQVTGGDSRPQQISWHDYIFEFEVEKKSKDVLEMLCGGYSQVQQLIGFIEVVQFVLEYCDSAAIAQRYHVFLSIADVMIVSLEEENEKFESVLESQQEQQQQLLGPNVSISKLTRRYMKLERVYLQQSKEYDAYSHTMHTHQFLTSHHFEVSSQAKDVKLKKDIDNLRQKQSSTVFDIYERPYETLKESAKRPMEPGSQEVIDAFKNVRNRIDKFTQDLFGNNSKLKVQDISYDYMHDLFEVYPNVRLHCQLACKMLEVICDIANQKDIYNFIKVRQAEYFETYQTLTNAQDGAFDESALNTPLVQLQNQFDYYAVEIKAKIICMQFKFFQRDERNIQKQAKDCLKRLLNKESNASEALPNLILKECVRPILNSLTTSRDKQGNFQHLSKLIKVCYSCFNEALGKHLARQYEQLEENIRAPYQTTNLSPMSSRERVQAEVAFLVDQYNLKIKQIETACGIVDSFRHLCKQRPNFMNDIADVIQRAFMFENFLIEDFERLFEEQLAKIMSLYDRQHQLVDYVKISPLQLRVGYLCSDLRQAVVKFYIHNQRSAPTTLDRSDQSKFSQIINERENFCLRERLSRDGVIGQVIRQARMNTNGILDPSRQQFDDRYVRAINMIYIFTKFHPQYLQQQRNVLILDDMRAKWINKVMPECFLLTETKSLYMKIQKSLVAYSRNEVSEIQILFDLLKDFQLNSVHIDMRPLIKLCTKEIPVLASSQKKKRIIEQALNKIQTSNCRYESKYSMFEFAFMPIALQCANDRAKFEEFFTPFLIKNFFETFFTAVQPVTPHQQQAQPQSQNSTWFEIYTQLEQRQKIQYVSFFTEIVKVLLIILKHSTWEQITQIVPESVLNEMYAFIKWILQVATDQSLVELTFYAISCVGMRLLGLRLLGEEQDSTPVTQDVPMTGSNVELQRYLTFLMESNMLTSFFDTDFQKCQSKTLIKTTLGQWVHILQNHKVRNLTGGDNRDPRFMVWYYFKSKYVNRQACQFRLYFSSLFAKQLLSTEVQDVNPEEVFSLLEQSIVQYVKKTPRGIDRDGYDLRQIMTITDALIRYTTQKRKQLRPGNDTDHIKLRQQAYGNFYIRTNSCFQMLLYNYNIDNLSAPKNKEQFQEFSLHCLQILDKVGALFPEAESSLRYDYEFSYFKEYRDLRTQYYAIYHLNTCGLAMTKGYKFPNQYQFIMEFLKQSQPNNTAEQGMRHIFSFSAVNYRLISFPIHLLKVLIRKRDQIITKDQLNELRQVVHSALQNDIKKSKERDFKHLQSELVKEYQNQQAQAGTMSPQQIISQQRAYEKRQLYKHLPNFSIHLIYALEQLRDEGHLTDQEFRGWVSNSQYEELNWSIYQIVSYFRGIVTQERENDQPVKRYMDQEFPENQCEFNLDDPDFDSWIKETLMQGMFSILKHLKSRVDPSDAFQIFENMKFLLKVIFIPHMCAYVLDWAFQMVQLLIEDRDIDIIKLNPREKTMWILKILNTPKLKELTQPREDPKSLVNKVYTMALNYIETNPNLLYNEYSVRIFDRLFTSKPCCSYENRQRMFSIFERFQGTALKHKVLYYFSKVSQDDQEMLVNFSQTNGLLDFCLHNFKQDVHLHAIRHSSKLIPLHNKQFRFQTNAQAQKHHQMTRIKEALGFFESNFKEYQKLKLEDMLRLLSEIIRLNPEHCDKLIADRIFMKIFWQFWIKIFQRQDHVILSADFQKLLMNMIKFSHVFSQSKAQFPRTMLEQIVTLKMPQVRIEPEILQYMGKNFNLWHIAIPMLEDHVQLFPGNERYVLALQELYTNLMEEDLSMGLSRLITKSPEMRSLYTFGQHHMWEHINTQFSQYINFFAEQEGLFHHLEQRQNQPGKYSRQIAKAAICSLMNDVEPTGQQYKFNATNENFDVIEQSPQCRYLSECAFPKMGSNRKVSELDVRQWETLYVQSLKILKKNELFKDLVDSMAGQEMHELRIEYLWQVKDEQKDDLHESNLQLLRKHLEELLYPTQANVLKKFNVNTGHLQRVRYNLYYNYILGIQGDEESRKFDENFKETTKMVIRQWIEFLPQYVDRIQNEYLILFQQIIESYDGGRNMISSSPNRHLKSPEYRTAMNMWRERLPNNCESIQTWQEILESRNLIFKKLKNNIIIQMQTSYQGHQMSIGEKEEIVDVCWNNLKLASISRKHGLFSLANHYLNQVKASVTDPNIKGDKMMLERFRFLYETNKIHLLTVPNSLKQQELFAENARFVQNSDYDLWMHAEILRLQGQFMLNRGDLDQAKKFLVESIEKNKKEAKTWISYARLNEIVLNEKGDEKSAMNALKGYFCALGLNQHKARLIIPFILRLVKHQRHQQSKHLATFVKQNAHQLPAWLWLFWIPQLIQLIRQQNRPLQNEIALFIYAKVLKLYPQPASYPLRAIHFYCRKEYQKNPKFQQLLNQSKAQINLKKPRANDGIEIMISEMRRALKSYDDPLLILLQELLNLSQFYFQRDIEVSLSKLYKKILGQHFDHTHPPSQVQTEFEKYFVNDDRPEHTIDEQMILLKNLKDFLLIEKNLKSQTQTLEEVFPQLASLSVKGIELPDQYITSMQEPLPEKIITIDRIESTVQRLGIGDKKLQFRCNNGKLLAYTFSAIGPKVQDCYAKNMSEERVNQLKILMNMMFTRHKESMRRGVKLHVAPRTLLPGCKMTQEDLTMTDFQETHDYLLMEQGVDPDAALVSQLSQIKQIFDSYPADKPKVLQSITAQQVYELNQNTYKLLCNKFEPYLLQSYFNRLFYNPDNLFLYKKQFTKYHAANSLFSYAFNQTENMKLNSIMFCKATGCLNFSETKLFNALIGKTTRNKTFEQVEADHFQLKTTFEDANDTKAENNIPFRLTPNLVKFIGVIGIHGTFAGVMTSASMALSANENRMLTILRLILNEEIVAQNTRQQDAGENQQAETPQEQAQKAQNAEQIANYNADYIMYKIKSLSQHERILDQTAPDPKLKAQALSQSRRNITENRQTGDYIVGANEKVTVPRAMFDLEMERPNISEEFNKKVFELIDMAQEEERLSQRQISWCSWF